MNKLNKKLAINISLVVVIVSILSLYINKTFIHRYYLYEKKKIVNEIGKELENSSIEQSIKSIGYLEKKYEASIVYTSVSSEGENDITQSLINELNKKGISLQKFWISKSKIEDMKEHSINEIYNQGKQKYSLLVKFILKDSYIFAVSIPIEHSQETIAIINNFNLILTSFSVFIIVILTFILSKKIIDPIEKIRLLSNDIAKLNFRTEEIKTGDEIQDLSESINKMSISLQNAQNELNKKNENLKVFIGGASHELKTPIALIKAYAIGIQDGIDDGTYIDTIISQSERMNYIINNLLYLSKLDKKQLKLSNVDIEDILKDIINEYRVILSDNNINLIVNIDESDFTSIVDSEDIKVVFRNLLSNSIKYSTDKIVYLNLYKNEKVHFDILNKANPDVEKELENLWEPFYVLEKSRNKQLSGTGLGLSLVKEILDSHKLDYGVKFIDENIHFYIEF